MLLSEDMATQYHGTAWVLGNMRKLLNLWGELLELGLCSKIWAEVGGGGEEQTIWYESAAVS